MNVFTGPNMFWVVNGTNLLQVEGLISCEVVPGTPEKKHGILKGRFLESQVPYFQGNSWGPNPFGEFFSNFLGNFFHFRFLVVVVMFLALFRWFFWWWWWWCLFFGAVWVLGATPSIIAFHWRSGSVHSLWRLEDGYGQPLADNFNQRLDRIDGFLPTT